MSHIPTIGFISTWPIYQGTTIDRYAHSLIQGISAAAHDCNCNLLLGCGFSTVGSSSQNRSIWPVPSAGVDFVPVGPWNTDGLIIVPDDLSEEQTQYVRDLLTSGFPLLFTTPEGPGPIVAVDNTLGIRQAFSHLLEHGHRQIAFIAGHSGSGGDSEERLRAYRQALQDAGLNEDSRLIAFGEHRKDDGATAMHQILASGAPFTAVIASNDLSCLGAIQCLKESGRRIPDDVAVIGFDDILDARSLSPSLTTVRHPTFSLGYQAVVTLLEYIQGRRKETARVTVPPRLIIRQSCGCPPAEANQPIPRREELAPTPVQVANLAHLMAENSLIEARNSPLEDLEKLCASLLEAFTESLRNQDIGTAVNGIKQVLAWTEERGEDAHIWQAGTAFLLQNMNTLLEIAPGSNRAFASSLIDRARLEVGDQIQRQTTRTMLGHMDMMLQLGLATTELLATMNIAESAEVLTRHLPQVGIKNALVALYESKGEDQIAEGVVLINAGLSDSINGIHFSTRTFPTPGIYPAGEPLQLTILPLEVDDETSGFVAFNAPNPELCAAIVYNLIAALRISRLYSDAVEGRRMAEEANQLKSRFLSMVSHELRTPLSLIVGLSDMVLREQQENGALSQSVTKDIEQINLSAQHLGRLIGDVLDLASSEAGQLHLIRQLLDLAEVLKVVTITGEQMARAKGLTWQANVPANGPFLTGDRTRLRQVMLNLISNAVKFTDQGEIKLDVEIHEKQVTLAVSDTGMGIPEAEQEQIFEEFHRSERSIRGGYSGLGLGLAVCKQLVHRHGGMIGVQSPLKDGRGSRFYFTLPIIPDQSAQQEVMPTTETQNQTILLLSEQAEVSDWLGHYLKERGFDIQVYRVEREMCLPPDIFERQPVAVIMDRTLAARQGWEIVGMLKRQTATENIPFLVCMLNAEENRGELLELNYMLKPLQPELLVRELVRQGLGKQHLILVVDDDPDILAIHTRIIEHAGYQALQAASGQQALTILEQTRPDLVLLDLLMPEIDGFQVLDQMRARETTRNIPVIVITGQVLTDTDIDRLNRSVATILSKGVFSAEETLAHIETALARRSSLGNISQRFVRQAITFIHTHFGEQITREDIANHIPISCDYLTDCFRQEMGVTPMAYLRRYRIHQARELLETSDLSIMQVALEVGFSENAHFTRTFQREVGMTPRAYRNTKRGFK